MSVAEHQTNVLKDKSLSGVVHQRNFHGRFGKIIHSTGRPLFQLGIYVRIVCPPNFHLNVPTGADLHSYSTN